ncbi:MAG: MerR family transcriptional regulator [Alphaproteobacteria bacterium]|nr:MerR family transcriptional regulator [Alphaproteobacteria bacterium]MDY4689827.1 MerR family transcriptional regulator [Alphaproteobacteria bacterium]
MYYSIGQVAAKTGLTVHTLRYYEKEGLLPFVRKSSSGLRMFSDNDLGWLSIIECLKKTGMPLKGIKQYIDWFREGDSTLPQRLEMFKQQQLKVLAQIEQFQKYLQKIDYKVKLYEEAVKLGSFEKAMKKFSS